MNKQISFYEDSMYYNMEFLNGNVRLPKIPGAYNIATGCGSGKTTIIKQIIEQNHGRGVIVFCKTIEECNNLYDFTVQNVVDHYDTGKVLKDHLHLDEVANLCSEPRIEEINGRMVCTNGVNNGWKDNLDSLGNKKVLIATHSVLMNTPIDKLMVTKYFNRPPQQAHMFMKAFRGVNEVNDIRQFMLIDEMPMIEPLQATLPSASFAFMMDLVTVMKPNYEVPGEVLTSKVFRCKSGFSFSQFMDSYETLERFDPDTFKLVKSNTELGNSRREMLLTALFVTLEEKMNKAFKDERKHIEIKYGLPAMIMTGGINTNVWLFDGTGDITLSTNPYLRFMSYPGKYLGEEVDLIKIHNNLRSRSIDVDKMFRKKDDVITELNKDVDLLKNIIKCNDETLIIVWKNLKSKFVKDSATYDLNLAKFVMNDEFDLVNYYKSKLDNCGELTGKRYHIIHYGSGKDLATNEFMNCDAIVRFGSYIIPNEGLRRLNEDLGTDMDMNRLVLYQNIQALSRTHIRLHEGRKVRFYMTDDFNSIHFTNLSNYLTSEGCRITEIDRNLDGVRPLLKDKFISLMTEIPEISMSFYSMRPLELDININELFRIIPVSEKKLGRYSSIISELDKYGIKLNVFTNSNNSK